jgi:hypothetical protein
MLRGMSDPKPPMDPAALLRRTIAAYDALQAAYLDHANDAPYIQAAHDALDSVVEEARRAVKEAPQPWRREKRRR